MYKRTGKFYSISFQLLLFPHLFVHHLNLKLFVFYSEIGLTMKLFIITFAFAVLVCAMESSIVQASDEATLGQVIMSRSDHFVQPEDGESVLGGNVCTGNIERACKNLCKTNNYQLKFQLTLKTDAYDCDCQSSTGHSNGDRETRGQCGPETLQACQNFCTLLGHGSRYDCTEYGKQEQECLCN